MKIECCVKDCLILRQHTFLFISKMKKVFLLLLVPCLSWARPPELPFNNRPPGKVIRTCCAFGVDVKMNMIPFAKVTSISAPSHLGTHKYLGNKQENNGIIYTHRGGFIDMGHLRDIADYTAYFYNLMITNRNQGLSNFKLGNEAGLKMISFQIPEPFTNKDIALLAGKLAYDLSIWHEMATWFGASYIPFIPERYSSFSIEDAYSNLLGVQIAIQAILSEKDYEHSMTELIQNTLQELRAVETIEDTREAMNEVKDNWWSSLVKMPNRKVMLMREFNCLENVQPWLIESWSSVEYSMELQVPKYSSQNELLTDFYQFSVKHSLRIPFKKIFPYSYKERIITQHDFPILLEYIKAEDKAYWEKARNSKFLQ